MNLLGHEHAWRAWRKALAGARLHHAWLLAGRKGMGKASFAAAAAHELVASARGEEGGTGWHPDILLLRPLPDGDDEERKRAEGKPHRTKRNIAIDQVRAMQRRLSTRPTLGERRAVIVDAADELERGAANALLKSLEEPPPGTVFLLVAHRPGRLPATIRSRCRLLRFAELDDAALAAVLAGAAPDLRAEERAAAVAAAGGSPGAALAFVERDLARAGAAMSRILAEGDADLSLRAGLASEAGRRPDRETISALLELACAMLARAAAAVDDRARQQRLVEAHAAMATLLAEAPTANFDPNLLVLEIGGLLASAAPRREAAR